MINRSNISKKILSKTTSTITEYNMIKDGENVAVALSGGKDSLTLVHILRRLQDFDRFRFNLVAMTVSYGMGEDYSFLTKHCNDYGIEHRVIESDIFEKAEKHIRNNSSFCSYFSRMRRGKLYGFCQENNFTKLAIGHHLDDAVESFMMNLTNNGIMRTMAPIYKAEDYDITIIRPLIRNRERENRSFVDENNFTAVGDEMCPAFGKNVKMPYKREQTKEMLNRWEVENNKIFEMFKSGFENIHIETFFDKRFTGKEF